MRGRNGTYGGTATQPYDNEYLRDDFELDDLEDDEVITIYDVDTVLGYTVDIFKIGFPFLFLIALFLGFIFMFGLYF
ncbi:MAG: hypothetical protein ACOX4Q_06980 [Syntrophomonadales bacterium]|jgi:hypothetical protein